MAWSEEDRPGADREAQFDGLYDEHQRTLNAFLLGRTGDPELALDLLQEAFVRAWRNLDLLLALGPMRQRAWLFATARNLVVGSPVSWLAGRMPGPRSGPGRGDPTGRPRGARRSGVRLVVAPARS